jgi:hypothetical protein
MRDSAGLGAGRPCSPPDFPRCLQGVSRWNRCLHCVTEKRLGHYWGRRTSQPSINREAAVIQLPPTRRPRVRQRGWGGASDWHRRVLSTATATASPSRAASAPGWPASAEPRHQGEQPGESGSQRQERQRPPPHLQRDKQPDPGHQGGAGEGQQQSRRQGQTDQAPSDQARGCSSGRRSQQGWRACTPSSTRPITSSRSVGSRTSWAIPAPRGPSPVGARWASGSVT